MCHHMDVDERAHEFVKTAEDADLDHEELEDEADTDRDEPNVRVTANADD